MEAYSLYQLNEYIRRVIALNFEDPIWIECEIGQVNEVRGNVYLELIEKSDEKDEIIAKSSASIWFKTNLFLKNKLGALYSSILGQGVKIKCKVQIEFSERYGMSLHIQDIDAKYTLGGLELKKQQIMARLEKDGFLGLNSLKLMPSVIQRIAIISSETAAGYIDFTRQIQENIYGYDYNLQLFQASMQGQNTEREVVAALKSINESKISFDVIVLIRGGGSKIDLSFFDNYNIGANIAKANVPVVVGIGHEIDQTVSDILAHTSVKTPTAAANYIIDINARFESEIIELQMKMHNRTTAILSQASFDLFQIQPRFENKALEKLNKAKHGLEMTETSLSRSSFVAFERHNRILDQAEKMLNILDPDKILKKGFTLIKQGKKRITSSKKLNHNNTFEIEFHDGSIKIKE